MLRRNSLGGKQSRGRDQPTRQSTKQAHYSTSGRNDKMSEGELLTDTLLVSRISSMEYLTNLNLSNNNLKGEICMWQALSKLTRLTSLDLSHNRLSHAHLSFLPEKLTMLTLDDNQLQELSLSKHLSHLVSLHCRSNRLLKASFPIANPSLTTLSLSHNKISILNTVQLQRLAKLQADHNELVVINLNPTIKIVRLQNCSLKSIMFIARLKELADLDVSYNQLSDVRLATYCQKLQLKSLDLSHNAIKFVQGLSSICPNIDKLYLNHNEIYSFKAIYGQIVQLEKLQQLYLDNNEFERREDAQYVGQMYKKIKNQLNFLKNINGLDMGFRTKKQVIIDQQLDESSIRQPNSPMPTTNRMSISSNYKESPYRLCVDVLSSRKDMSNHKTAQRYQPESTVNITLGAEQNVSRRLCQEMTDREVTMRNDQSLKQKMVNLAEGTYEKPKSKKIQVFKKPEKNNLQKELMMALSAAALIPVRPILKTQKTKDVCIKLENGLQIEILHKIFKNFNRRPECIRKNTNLNKIHEIVKDIGSGEYWMNLAFLRPQTIEPKVIRLLFTGKINLLQFLAEVKKATLSEHPDPKSNQHILTLTNSFDPRIHRQEGIPIEAVGKMTPLYLIETNDIEP